MLAETEIRLASETVEELRNLLIEADQKIGTLEAEKTAKSKQTQVKEISV